MTAIIAWVFSVCGLVVTLLISTLWLRFRLAPGAARRALVSVVAVYALSSLYAVPYGISRILVVGYRQFSTLDAGPGRTAIVVLGSGASPVRGWDQESLPVMSPIDAARIIETFRVYRRSADAWVISSGGAVSAAPGAPTTGAMMEEMLVRLGVPSSRILVESESRTTREEAVLVAPMLRLIHPDHVILVTSDIHMRRALGAFRSANVIATPAIARDPYMGGWETWGLPTTQGLAFTADVLHEIVGLGYYAARGWWR
jgi:uncharacterized SAM-binding protein YcdF (DUF218 family)